MKAGLRRAVKGSGQLLHEDDKLYLFKILQETVEYAEPQEELWALENGAG